MWLYHVSVGITRTLERIPGYWDVRLRGAVDSIPRTGPLIVAPNHGSFLDPFFLMQVFPRNLHYLVNSQWYDKSRLWHAYFVAMGTERVVAGDPLGTIHALGRVLDRQEAVGIFPEGLISADGRIRRFKPGVARVAALTGAPVVPVGLRGNFESLPRHQRVPRKVRVEIHVGEPLTFAGAPKPEPTQAELRAFLDRLTSAVCTLAGQEDRIDLLTRGRSCAAETAPSADPEFEG